LETLYRIVKGCVNGESNYQRMFYDRYRGYAFKLVFRYIYRYEKALDVVTDGFVKAFLHFENFKVDHEGGIEKLLMGWLKRIMINTAIDELRRNEMTPEIGGIPEDIWETPDESQHADQLLLFKDLLLMVKELPPNYRTVFNLYVIDGYIHSQIADLLSISIGTSKSYLSRARSLLQENLRKLEEGKLCRI
jgi:RNA polymerase sigma factor (sigma-70 family)